MGLSADDRRATRFLPDDAGAAPPVGLDLAPAWPTRNGGAARAARPRDRDRREAPAGGISERNQPADRAHVSAIPRVSNSKTPPRNDRGGALVLGTRRSLSLSPPSEPRQSADEQARNHNHHAGDEYGQAGKQQKVTREKTHSRASPLPPCAASILTLRGIALRLLPDSGAITKYFTQHASPPRRRDHSITSSRGRAASAGLRGRASWQSVR
jgi:hypothetical protein